MFTSLWAVPAVSTPAGLVPGMARLPRVRSRQPVVSTVARGLSSWRPSCGLQRVSLPSAEIAVTIESGWYSIPAAVTSRQK